MICRVTFAMLLAFVLSAASADAKLAVGKHTCPATMSCIEMVLAQSAIPQPMSPAPDAQVPEVCVKDVMGNLEQEDMPVCEAFIDGGAGTPRQRATALINLGHAYTRMPGTMLKPEVAMAAWDKAMAEDPSSAEPHAIKGDVAARKRNIEEAIAEFDRALALDPKHWRALMGKAHMFMKRDQTFEAVQLGYAALRNAEDVAVAHQLYGGLLEKVGKLTEALVEYRIATVGYDRNVFRRLPGLWQEGSPWSDVARLEMRLGHPASAIDAISHEIDGRRTQNISPDLLVQRGEYYEALGRLTDAANDYEKAMSGYGANIFDAEEYRARIAMLRAQAGNGEAARTTFHDLLRSGKLQSILRVQVFLKNSGFDDIEINGKVSPALEKALDRCLSEPDCSVSIGQSI